MKTAVVLVLLVAVAPALALTQAYAVEPVTQEWSGWTPLYGSVSQIVTANFDSVVYCELFVGQADTSPFSVNVYEYPGGIDWD